MGLSMNEKNSSVAAHAPKLIISLLSTITENAEEIGIEPIYTSWLLSPTTEESNLLYNSRYRHFHICYSSKNEFNISGATLIRRSYYYQQDVPPSRLIWSRFAFCLLAIHGSSLRSRSAYSCSHLGVSPRALSYQPHFPACLLSTPMLKLEQALVSKPLRYGTSLSLLRLFLYRSNLYGCVLHWIIDMAYSLIAGVCKL